MSFVLLTHLALSLLAGKAEPRWMFYQSAGFGVNQIIQGDKRLKLEYKCYSSGNSRVWVLDDGYALTGLLGFVKSVSVKQSHDTIFVNSTSTQNKYSICGGGDPGECVVRSIFYLPSRKRQVVRWKDDKGENDFTAVFGKRGVWISGVVYGEMYKGHFYRWKWNKRMDQNCSLFLS